MLLKAMETHLGKVKDLQSYLIRKDKVANARKTTYVTFKSDLDIENIV